MNGKTLLQSMTEIDEKLIREADLTMISISQKKHRKRIQMATFAAVAALAMTTTAGALTGVFDHRETVESYLHGNSRKQLEEKGLVTNYVTENDYFRLTAETILNDGFQIYMIATLEPLEETAQEFLAMHNSFSVDMPIIYTDTGEEAEVFSGSVGFQTKNGKNLIEFSNHLTMLEDRPTEIQLNMQPKNEEYQYMLENLSIPLEELPMLEQVKFQNEENQVMVLTPLELYSEESLTLPDINHQIYFIKQDGTKFSVGFDGRDGLEISGGARSDPADSEMEPFFYVLFEEIPDLNEIQSIEFYNANTNTSVIYEKSTE